MQRTPARARPPALRARPPAALLLLALAAAAAVATPAQAFTSLPPGSSVHDEITAVAADAGFPEDAVEALQQAVREPDMDETEWDPDVDEPARIDARAAYRAEHHCDRTPGTADAEAFAATTRYIQAQRGEAVQASAANDTDAAMAALGRALHALQDCFSHSNAVDLDAQALGAFEQAVLKGGDAPAGLRLVSYDPGADDPEDPEGDDYTHKDYAKDDADKNDESKAASPHDANQTKFESARDLARMATVAFLQEFVHALPEDQRALFVQARPDADNGKPDGGNIPAPGLLALLACLAWAVALWRKGPA